MLPFGELPRCEKNTGLISISIHNSKTARLFRGDGERIKRQKKGFGLAVSGSANFIDAMPGKCKFQDSWLSKGIYKDWLVKDHHDIHFARCRACCKSIKLQTMGEAALTSHAGGAGHKAAVRKLVEGSPASILKCAEELVRHVHT